MTVACLEFRFWIHRVFADSWICLMIGIFQRLHPFKALDVRTRHHELLGSSTGKSIVCCILGFISGLFGKYCDVENYIRGGGEGYGIGIWHLFCRYMRRNLFLESSQSFIKVHPSICLIIFSGFS
ncbi:hypothetical protein EYC84_012138 [Monilinia fructicola]|uniref:Uncharacterized protein n=1 Tax=Monilinia fructicola TaxID=38448 RepID=A0A5M9J585_MONFR|nr:hypothetical protein EYC84_012138 [Monilinia fructicola]